MESYEEVRKLNDEQVIDRINVLAQTTQVGTGFWFDEITRRSTGRASERAEKLMGRAVWLTVANMVIALIAAVAAVIALAG